MLTSQPGSRGAGALQRPGARCVGAAFSRLARPQTSRPARRCPRGLVRAQKIADKEEASSGGGSSGSSDDVTRKYGLEAGLWNVFRGKGGDGDGRSKGQQAKDLLKRYGSAYLITSISLSLVSFSLCYALVSAGVDVSALLQRFGLAVSGTNEKVGTVAIAYAAHKALSPVRFPPTVALTPVLARLLGKDSPAGGQ